MPSVGVDLLEIARLEAQIAKELKFKPNLSGLTTRAEVDAMLAKVRAEGIAPLSEHYMFKGVEAVAAPVFNFKNQISMSLVVVGVEGMIDMTEGGHVVQELKKSAAALSWRLGATRNPKPETAPDLIEPDT